jgi:hypothetical protein
MSFSNLFRFGPEASLPILLINAEASMSITLGKLMQPLRLAAQMLGTARL